MEDNKVIFSMERVGKIYPGNKQVLRDISLGYYYGAKIGVLGLNGSGKSTLLRIMAGVETDYIGRIAMSKGYTIGYLEQDPQLQPDKTVMDIVEEGAAETVALLKRYDEINEKFSEPMSDEDMNKLLEEQGNLQDKLDACNAWDLQSRLEMAMNALRCPPPEMPIKLISGGEKRRVALCRLLLKEPDILLLDEPTNHLDAETILWLENHLHQYKGTVIAITHDRYFLDNVAGWILELDRGYGIPWRGNYSSWLEQKQQALAIEENKETRRQQQLARELEWIKATPKAKHEKNKARINNYEKLASEEYEKRNETNELHIPAGPKLGNVVIRAKSLMKGYDDKMLFEGLDFDLPAGGIIGIIGANGAGKTTLFRLITGEEKADAGVIEIGETVKLSYVDQDRLLGASNSPPTPSQEGNTALSPQSTTHSPQSKDPTILDLIGQGRDMMTINNREIPVRQYISWFNFASSDHHKRISELSGGERNRTYLALTLQTGGNVLLLDEPTNDLDVNTIRALEEALQNFPGCAVVISHDRYFLDRICTHILAFEGDSSISWYDGNFSEYEEDKLKRLGEKALIPKRITYRRLTRV